MINLSLINITSYFILIYIIFDSSNIIYKTKDYKINGILYLYPVDTVFTQLKFLNFNQIKFLINPKIYILVICLRLLLSIFISLNLCSFSFFLFLFIFQIYLHYRNESLFNLADKYVINILLALSLFYNFDGSFIIQVSSIFFIALLTIITYFFTAYFKLKGDTWRRGLALEQILSTDLYGNEKYYNFLIKHKLISKFLNYSTVVFQLMAPLTILSSKFAIVYFIIGFLFHLSIAVIMNLNNFFWIFLSTYPCIYLMSITVENYLWN